MKKNKLRPALSLSGLQIRFDRWTGAKIIILLVIFSLGWYSVCCLKKLDYFKVKQVVVRQDNNTLTGEEAGVFSYLKGRNIFGLDLEKESRRISGLYPSYKKIRLVRYMPNLLLVDFLKRKPLACIKSYRSFYVDESLTLFEMPKGEEPSGLPQIFGLDKKIAGAKYGTKFFCPELELALEIIREAQANKPLKDYQIKKIDVTDSRLASIFMLVFDSLSGYTKDQIPNPEEGLQVRLGEDNIRAKIELLSTLLAQVRNSLGSIKYIDLRFKEPLIKFKDLKEGY
jgi:cell division septal protein FtsQ